MKTFKPIIAGAAVLLTLAACSKTEETPEEETKYDDAHWAALATVSSDDASFVATEDGGTVYFGVSGGEVMITVDCGTEWTARNSASDLFTTTANTGAGTLVVGAAENRDEEEKTATVTLLTAEEEIEFATITVIQEAYGAPTVTADVEEWHAPAKGNLSTEIAVESSVGEYDVDYAADWLSVEQTSTGLGLTAAENEDTEERAVTITLSCTDGYRTGYQTVKVTQDGLAYISLSDTGIDFEAEGGTASVTVETNYDWEYTCDSDWFTVSVDGATLSVSVSENEGSDERESIVTITAGDGAENVAEASLTVYQDAPEGPMILVFTTEDASTKVTLPLAETVDCTVDWGDGSDVQSVTSASPTHTYESAGEYEVTITGTVTGLAYSGTNGKYLTEVRKWGATGLTSMNKAFYQCTNLKSLPAKTGKALSEVTTFENAFYSCAFENIPADLFKRSTKATGFKQTFYGCASLVEIPDGLFDGCTAATDMQGTFYKCSALTAIPKGLLDYNTALTTVSQLFYYCTSLTDIPAGLFDHTRELTSFASCFRMCSALTTVPDYLFKDLSIPSETASTYCVFRGCTSLKNVGKGIFEGCSGAVSFQYTFYQCSSLETVPGDIFSGCTAVTDFSYVFSECTGLKSVPEDLFADTQSGKTFSQGFNGCTALESVPAGLFSNMKDLTTLGALFNGCTSLGGESPYDEITVDGETVKVHLYDRNNYTSVYSMVTANSMVFTGCTGLSDYDDIPSDWK